MATTHQPQGTGNVPKSVPPLLPPEQVAMLIKDSGVTVDRAESERWRFGEANGFVIRDWTGVAKGGDPVVFVLKAADIFDFIADASQRKAKIAAYAIGPCVLDWS